MFRLLPTILSFLLWLIQVIPSDIMNMPIPTNSGVLVTFWFDLQKVLYQYRAPIGFTFFLIVAFTNVRYSVYLPRRRTQAIVYNQLKEIMVQCFKSQQAQVRITIFKRAGWREAITHYVYHSLWKDFPRGLPFIGFKQMIRGIPIPFSGEFLIIFSRLGTPGQRVLSTIFKIPDDSELVEGIVGLAWKARTPVKRKLPDIRNLQNQIKKSESLDSLDTEVKEKVKQYMNEGNVRRFASLRAMHRMSVFLWAHILDDSSGDPWGVIVVDSSESEVVTPEAEITLQHHVDNIQRIIVRNIREGRSM